MWPIFPQSFSRNLFIYLSLIPAKTTKQWKNQTTQSLSDKQSISSTDFQQKSVYIYHWLQQKSQNYKKPNLSEPLRQTANFIQKLSAENCRLYNVRTEKIKLMSKNKGNIMCQMLLSLRLGNILCMSHSYAVRTEKQDKLFSFIFFSFDIN